MTPSESIQELKLKLADLDKVDFGYPSGVNVISESNHPNGLPPSFSTIAGSKWLSTFYLVCDGLSFPDVHVGYFVKPLDRVMSFDRSSEPDTLVLESPVGILPIGSTGGGDLFVVGCECGNVLLLPPGPLQNGRYDGTNRTIKEVAATVPLFIERLLADLTAFINGDKQHEYIA